MTTNALPPTRPRLRDVGFKPDNAIIDLSHLPPVLTLREAAQVMRISPTTAYRRVRSGEFDCLRTRPGRGGRLLFTRDAVLAFLARLAS